MPFRLPLAVAAVCVLLSACGSSSTKAASSSSGSTTTTSPDLSTIGTGVVSGSDQSLDLNPPTGKAPSVAAGSACSALADAGWKSKCLVVTTANGTLTGLIETKPAADGYSPLWQASVWVQHGSTLVQSLHAGTADDQYFWEWLNLTSSDVLGDGRRELLFGFENQGTGAILDIDAVSADGASVLANEQISIYKGAATVQGSRVVTHHPIYKDGDANCCPSGGDGSDTVTFAQGRWSVTASRHVSPPPANQQWPDDFADPNL